MQTIYLMSRINRVVDVHDTALDEITTYYLFALRE